MIIMATDEVMIQHKAISQECWLNLVLDYFNRIAIIN